MFCGYFSFVATTLTLTPSASATRMSSHSSEIFAAATTYNPGSRTSQDGKHMDTSVILSSGINTGTEIPISGITLRREETTLFEVETIMATSLSSSSSVSAANHKELNSENSLDTENPLNSVNNFPQSLGPKWRRECLPYVTVLCPAAEKSDCLKFFLDL